MSDSTELSRSGAVHAAYDEGRRAGPVAGAFALSIVAFVNLLGMEKSILAGVLALLAMLTLSDAIAWGLSLNAIAFALILACVAASVRTDAVQ